MVRTVMAAELSQRLNSIERKNYTSHLKKSLNKFQNMVKKYPNLDKLETNTGVVSILGRSSVIHKVDDEAYIYRDSANEFIFTIGENEKSEKTVIIVDVKSNAKNQRNRWSLG